MVSIEAKIKKASRKFDGSKYVLTSTRLCTRTPRGDGYTCVMLKDIKKSSRRVVKRRKSVKSSRKGSRKVSRTGSRRKSVKRTRKVSRRVKKSGKRTIKRRATRKSSRRVSRKTPNYFNPSGTNKYSRRASPPHPANSFCGKTKKGNDGRLYLSKRNSIGICRWVKK